MNDAPSPRTSSPGRSTPTPDGGTYGVAVLTQERDTDETGRVVDRGETGIPVAGQREFLPLAVCANGAVLYDASTGTVLHAPHAGRVPALRAMELAVRRYRVVALRSRVSVRTTRRLHSSSRRPGTPTPG